MADTLTRGAIPDRLENVVPGHRRPGKFLPLAALVGAQVILLGWLTRDTWFFVDDFLFLAQAREQDFSLDFLRLPLFEHFSPVHRIFDFLFVHAFGLNFAVARGVLLVLVAACIFAFYATARALLSSPRLALALTGAYGTSLFFVRNATWWTGGVHLFTLTLFSLLTFLGYIRWYRQRERKWWILSAAAYAGALLSHEQAMLLPAYLVLATLLLLSPRFSLRSVFREWPLWVIYGVLTGAAMLNYFDKYHHSHGGASLGEIGRFLSISLFEGILPTLLGLKVPEAAIFSQQFTVALACLIAAVVVAVSIRRSRHAWRAWSFFLATFLIATLPLGLGRVVLLGVQVGREPRYQTACAFLGLLAIGAAFDARCSPARDRNHQVRPERRSDTRAVKVAVLVALYLIFHVRGAVRVHDSLWEPHGPEQYFQTFESQAAPIKETEKDVHLFPGTVPESVIPAPLFPFNRFEHALVLADSSVRIGMRREAFVVEPDGRLTPAAFRPQSSVQPGMSDHRLEGMEPIAAKEPGTLCATTRTQGQLRISTPPPPAGKLLAGITYESSARQVAVFAEQEGRISELMPFTRPAPGPNERYLEVPDGPVNAVVFNLIGPGSICVARVELGSVLST